jgi:hypothetical protein
MTSGESWLWRSGMVASGTGKFQRLKGEMQGK